MILSILNLIIPTFKRFPKLQSLVDQFVGNRLDSEKEHIREKSLQVIRFFGEYTIYLIRQDICIWENSHQWLDMNDESEAMIPNPDGGWDYVYEEVYIQPQINTYRRVRYTSSIDGRGVSGTINSIFRNAIQYGHEQREYYDDIRSNSEWSTDEIDRFVLSRIYCAYNSLFDPTVKKKTFGKCVCQTVENYVENNDSVITIREEYLLECKCFICRGLNVV
jgi:hypothetical protein